MLYTISYILLYILYTMYIQVYTVLRNGRGLLAGVQGRRSVATAGMTSSIYICILCA